MRNYRVEFHVSDCVYLVAELYMEAAGDERVKQAAIDAICAAAPQWKPEELAAFPTVVEFISAEELMERA